ncbi:MAG: sugar transferase [Clostridia bacterium]|nr:sugar transferase [Clostridia bacterium]
MYKHFLKRFFDIVFSLIGLPFVLLTVIIAAPFIWLTDGGRVFYRARRRGRNGRVFSMLKLRTMYENAEEIRNPDGSVYSGKNDPRVTPVGRILRKLSVDELPQIINVLKGDMSFIGPRPHLATTDYESLDGMRKKRLTVRPGITGYSQAYYRNSATLDQKIKNDCYYVDNLSFLLDLKIIFKTAQTVLTRRNIYSDTQQLPGNARLSEEENVVGGEDAPAMENAADNTVDNAAEKVGEYVRTGGVKDDE